MRKLRGIGKKPVTETAISKTESHKPEKTIESEVKTEKTKKKITNFGVSIPDSEVVPFEKAKSQEIFTHLGTVLTVSVACLVILGILYYLERQVDWVNMINLKINGIVSRLNW